MDIKQRPVKGVVIRPDCTYEELVLKELVDYQKAIDGFIEAVRLYNYDGEEIACAYVDEEGLLKKLSLNPLGSAISFLFGNHPYVMGSMVIVGKSDEEGYDTDIPEFILLLARNICAKADLDQTI